MMVELKGCILPPSILTKEKNSSMKPSSQINNLSLCFPRGADIETRFKTLPKQKGVNPRKPQTMEIMKKQTFPQNSLLLSQQQSFCLLQTLTWSEEGHSPYFCISKRIVLAWSLRESTLHWSLVRLSCLYSRLPQNRPVNSWDPQEGHMNCQSLWMGHASCPFLSQLNHKQQASTEDEDTQQARLHNYDMESMVQTLSPCPMNELRLCLGWALPSGMGWLIASDSLKSQADETESTARTDAELYADARTMSHLALRMHQHFKSWAWLWSLSSEKNDASISWAMKVPGCILKQAYLHWSH